MKILSASERTSDKIIRKLTAEILNIPECDSDIEKTAEEDKCCSCSAGETCKDCRCHKSAGACPQCGADMQRNGNMEKCACGYGQATAGVTKTATRPKLAAETSVVEYYKKIYPDDYVADLTSDKGCVTPDAGSKVEYGHVPIDKKVSLRVTARELLAEGYEGAGDCEVKDSHPESGVNSGSGSEKVPDPKWQKGDSANSVSGPEKAKSIGPGLKAPGDVASPDLGLPKGAGKWITRDVMSKICPSCADDMERRGIRAVSAEFVAKTLAETISKRADSRGLLRQGTNVCPKCGSGLDDYGNCTTCGKQDQAVYAAKPVNPWAVCHKSVGPEKSEKFERCVKDVKKKSPIKK